MAKSWAARLVQVTGSAAWLVQVTGSAAWLVQELFVDQALKKFNL